MERKAETDLLESLRVAYADLTGRTELPEHINELTYSVIGAAIEVHRHIGPGFLEAAYAEALAIELSLRGIRFVRQQPISLEYKGHTIWTGQIDLIVENELVIELKAVETIHTIHRVQLLSYLRATRVSLGLLLNFNVPTMKDGVHRVIAKSSL